MTNVRCKDCGVDLGPLISWDMLKETDEIFCTMCAMKEFDIT